MAFISTVFLVLSITIVGGIAQPNQASLIGFDNSLRYPHSWLSPSKRFAFGLYQQGSGFAVGIWLVGMENKTIVWTANRDKPLVTSNAMVEFARDSELLLRTEQGPELVIASAEVPVSYAAMLDSGNFVLYDREYNIVWMSFDNPTDTILGGQTLLAGKQLYSSFSQSNHSIGRFLLAMQSDGNLVSYPVNSEETALDAYWHTGTSGSGYNPEDIYFVLDLNSTGRLIVFNKNDSVTVAILYEESASNFNNNNNNTIYRATLDVDGVFRLYSHTYYESRNYRVSRLWSSLNSSCLVKDICALNSFCAINDNQTTCRCLPGHDFVDHNQSNLGCSRNFSEAECRGGKGNAAFYNMTTMENMEWGDTPYIAEQMSKEDCSISCLEDCNCGAALFVNNHCQKQQFPLKYVRRVDYGYAAFLKVGLIQKRRQPPILSKIAMVQIVLVTSGFTILSCVALAIFVCFILKIRVLTYKRTLKNGNLGLPEQVTLRLFTYTELKRATNSFKEELGKGSFGTVYKGALNKGKKLVAVKRLEKLVEEGEREFRAEMRAIGRTHHRNLVRLLGFCAEDTKRLLVYEYMSNGSLCT